MFKTIGLLFLSIPILFRGTKKIIATTTDSGISKEIDTLARTLWGEARGEGYNGIQGVCNVILNRIKKGGWWGATVEDVCKKPYQFSCWNMNDGNYNKCMAVNTSDKHFNICLEIAKLGVDGQLPDLTGGANHYHTKAVKPAWSDKNKQTAEIGNHLFFKL